MTWIRAGRTGVDAGASLITDPCYVVRDAGNPPHQPYQSYEQLLGALGEVVDVDGASQLTNEFGADIGVYITNFGGDGVFPVFVDVDSSGMVRGAQIRFDGEAPR
jgi:hypothetical protein